MRRIGKLSTLVIAALASLQFVAASEDSYRIHCVQAYPEPIQARMETRAQLLKNLLPSAFDGIRTESVISRLKTWNPADTVTVAFHEGSYDLRFRIMNVASEWSKHANLKFDFGHDAQSRSFREWSPTDTEYRSDIRVSFSYAGYWSYVGTDSIDVGIANSGDPSLNLGGFAIGLPSEWEGTVLHEFGHAIGLEHEHQFPNDGCDSQFRWYDDPGYVPTTNSRGEYIVDTQGMRPGIYTVLGGPPNEWPKSKVDFNLRQLSSSNAYLTTAFDAASIMKYYFEPWMFVNGQKSYCYNGTANNNLSPGDIAGIQRAYPHSKNELDVFIEERKALIESVVSIEGLPESKFDQLKEQERTLLAP